MVSVIVPIYNVEGFLRQCVDSILGQTYKDLEVILVDDGSTDSCPAICDEYAAIDSRVRVIHKPNGGLSDARNAGLDIATGQYITLVDSDDIIKPNMIETLLELMATNNSDLACCQPYNIDENDAEVGSPLHQTNKREVIEGNTLCMEKFFRDNEISTTAWGKLYKSNLFNEIRYPKGRYHEDVFTTYRVVALCDTIAITSNCLYGYRIRQSSIMNSRFSEKHVDAIYGKQQIANFVGEKYPSLLPAANAGIVYAANQVLLRILRSGDMLAFEKFRPMIQGIYRKYETYHLKSRSRLSSKLFSLISTINVSLTKFLYQFIRY